MSILNEIPIMSEFNIWMIIGGLFAVGIGCWILLPIIRFDDISGTKIFFGLLVGITLVAAGLTSLMLHANPDYQYPTGKVQIEAVFPKGKPTAFILDKYDVIEQRGRIWVLEEK